MARGETANNQDDCDEIFQAMVSTPDLRSVDDAGDREGLRRDVRRIASVLFCSVDIDPSIVTFAKTRAALHWGLPEHDVDAYNTGSGLTMDTASWFHDHDVAAVATDNLTFEVFPCEDMTAILPVHPLHLVEMGMTQGQNWMLEDLADDCVADGAYEFFLEASPQPFTNALGSPVNPVAIK